VTASGSVPPSIPLGIAEARLALDAGLLSCTDVVHGCLRAAHAFDEAWGAFATRFDDSALAYAQVVDERRLAGDSDGGLLSGIPLAVKDLILTAEGPTRAQSAVLEEGLTGQDAVCVQRLRSAGGVIVGKAATMEFAVGPPDSVAGPHRHPSRATHNPWDPARWTGGSSAGTACVVASGMALGGLGTDTGGSVRIPAALCGITGMKPTYGLIPKTGCIPLAYSLDHIGPMARSAYDCALLLEVLAGRDDGDPASVDLVPQAYSALLAADVDLSGLTIGVDSLTRFVEPLVLDQAVPDVFSAAVGVLESLGARVVPVELPLYEELTEVYSVTMTAEALAYHAMDLSTRWHDYGVGTRTLLASGAFYTAADYVQAQRIRRAGQKAVAAMFGTVDLVVTPTTSVAAPLLSELDRYYSVEGLAALHTQYWNAVGNPAISVPMGFNGGGLPLGLQIAGPPFADGAVLRAGDAYQRATDWHRRVPGPVRPLYAGAALSPQV
jgi:aspartyl-tRNA(Asn)/glutamyl-tRNA(Gln) amidotransferase subunit A